MSYDDPVPELMNYVPEINLGRPVNSKNPCYIIAEIGQNHQGDIMLAKKLMKMAKVSEQKTSVVSILLLVQQKY